MNKPFTTMSAALLALAACASGCAPTSPQFERSFGNAVRASVAAQVADPAAVRNTNPVSGMDGPAARAAYQRYQESFSKPEPQVPMQDIGGGK